MKAGELKAMLDRVTDDTEVIIEIEDRPVNIEILSATWDLADHTFTLKGQ
jgi:hypothetical protein